MEAFLQCGKAEIIEAYSSTNKLGAYDFSVYDS